MNIVEAWNDFTSSEKLMFQNCCRKILRRTFLVRDKQEDRKHYFFVVNHIDSFLNYFSFMGFEVKCDKDNGVVMLDNCSEIGDKDKLQSNRYRFTKEETIVLCCLWLYPSLQFALDTNEFERFVKEVVEVVLEGKDSLEEDANEQTDNVE